MKKFSIPKNKNFLAALQELGYHHRLFQNDFLRADANGRFHAKEKDGKIEVHYDMFGTSGSHVSNLPFTNLLLGEQRKIQLLVNAQMKK